ncbi:MAG: ATP-binding protein [Anaerolineales bacterium]|nr:MAG: ATP-binding protein [Anaerolineales bacterium]
MDKKISATLDKVLNATQKASSPNTSNNVVAMPMLGKPDCPYCNGIGFLREDFPVGHEKFGKIEPCICRANDIAENARQRLYEMSNLERLSHLTFANFNPSGNPKAKFTTNQDISTLNQALQVSENFAKDLTGWLLLEGSYGCGKTHLAAAIANQSVQRGVPTLFITVPDLLDSLRFAYNDPETTFEQRFEDIRNADLLIMDDFGTQNATPWAQEKLFQIINYRYINKLPTVITTNLILDEIESRIRSRLQDAEFVKYVRITAPDYRRPTETSNPGISMLSLPHIKEMSFGNFETRDDEVGKEIVTTIIKERLDKFGRSFKDKEIVREKVTQHHVKKLHDALTAAVQFAENPNSWLVLIGGSYCGKTHLAAAIGNYRQLGEGQVLFVEVSNLLDYLKATFRPSSDVTFDRRFYEISTAPLLMLDDLKESGVSSVWAEDKLHQILNHRYYANLPTVITSTLDPESFAKSYPSLWNKLLDTSKCQICVIDMPPYRKSAKGKKAAAKKGRG